MADEATTLQMWGQQGLPASLEHHVRERAQRVREQFGDEMRVHVSSLEALAGYVSTCGLQDQRFWALGQTSAVLGGDMDRFTAGPIQKELLDRIGSDFRFSPPSADVTLDELVGAACADVIAFLREKETELQQEVVAARAEAAGLIDQAGAMAALEQENAAQRDRIAALEATNAALEETSAFLRSHLGKNAESERKAKKPRRTSVEGHTGVYLSSDGETYEVNYPVDGKTKWKTIGTDLQEAIEARKELVSAGKEAVPA